MDEWRVMYKIADESVPKWIPQFIRKWFVTREYKKLLRILEYEMRRGRN
jgi:hypothetical protein